MNKILTLVATLSFAATAHTQTQTLTARFTDVLHRAETGHSPTIEDLAAAADPSQPIPDAASIADALPLMLKAADDKDVQVRQYALITIQGFRSGETNPVYKAPVAKALTPGIARLAAHLTDEDAQNRMYTAILLGGFAPNPPAAVYPPLLAYLKRDDAIGATGVSVVIDLLGLGPISTETSDAVVKYMHRADQTADSRSNLVDAISTQGNQSAAVNLAMLGWLNSDDNALRARVILTLPLLDLPAEPFADTRARIAQLAQNDSENLQVVTAAKSITTCWTAVHMTTPCPVYDTPAADKPATPATPQ